MSSEITKICDVCGKDEKVEDHYTVPAKWMNLEVRAADGCCNCYSHFDICGDCIKANPALVMFYGDCFNLSEKEVLTAPCKEVTE